MKKLTFILVIALLFTAIPFTVMAQEESFEIKIDGKVLEIPKELGSPYIDERGRTQIPARAIIEGLGFIVKWEGDTQTISILDSGEKEIASLQIGSKKVNTPDGAVEMDTKAIIKEGRTYVPLRFVTAALGFHIPKEDGYRFENKTHYIKIEKPAAKTLEKTDASNLKESHFDTPENQGLKIHKQITLNDSEIAVSKDILVKEDEMIMVTTDKLPYSYYEPAHHYLKYYNTKTGEHIRTIDLGVVKRINFKISNKQKYIVKYIDDGLGYLELYSLPDYKFIGKIVDSETKKAKGKFSFLEELNILKVQAYQAPLINFSEDDRYMIFTSFNSEEGNNYRSSIVLWNLETLKEEKIFYPGKSYDEKIKEIDYIWISPNHDKIFWYIHNKHIKNELVEQNVRDYYVEIPAVDIKTGEILYVAGYKKGQGESFSHSGLTDRVNVVFNKANNLMGIYAENNAYSVKVFDIKDGKKVFYFDRTKGNLYYFLRDFQFTNDNKIWVSFTDGSVLCKDILTGDYEEVIKDNYPISGCIRSEDGSIIITQAFFSLTLKDNQLVRKYEPRYAKYDYKIWDGTTKKPIKVLYHHNKIDKVLGLSKDGNYLITLDYEEKVDSSQLPYGSRKINSIHIWDITNINS